VELWKPVPDGAREVPPGGVCPKCRSPRVHRSRVRNVVEQAARAVSPYRPFSCSACKWRGWCWPVPSQGLLQPLPPLPSRRRRSSAGSGRKGVHQMSPAEYQRYRYRQHVVITALLAVVTGGSVFYCQRDPNAREMSEQGVSAE
jgi:hypothetical protein